MAGGGPDLPHFGPVVPSFGGRPGRPVPFLLFSSVPIMRVSRSQLSVLCVLAVAVLGLLVVVDTSTAPPAEAYTGDPAAPPVPMVHAGAATAAGAFTTLGVAGTLQASAGACATGAGCVVVATGAVAGAGFATGYYGAAAVCAGASFLMDPTGERNACNPWEPVEAEPGGYTTTGFQPCTTFGVAGNQCVKVSWDELSDKGHGTQRFVLEPRDKDGNRFSWTVNGDGQVGGCGTSDFGGSYMNNVLMAGPTSGPVCTDKVGMPMQAPRGGAPYTDKWTIAAKNCTGLVEGFRNCGVRPGDLFYIRAMLNAWFTGGPWDSSWSYSGVHSDLYGVSDIAPEVNERGEEIKYRVQAQCWTAPSTVVTAENVGGWYFESDRPDLPENPCPEGSTVKEFDIDMTRAPRTSGGTLEWQEKYSWDAPEEWTTSTWPHQECVRVGAECVVEEVEVTPELTQCEWGGVVVLMSYCEEPKPELVPRTQLEENPEPEDPPAPTTTIAPTTTVPVTTTTTPDESVPPSEPPGPPAPPEGGDNQWSTCMDSQVGDDWSDVTWNPVTWVRAIIYYVTAPIICALWWLVVPAGGLDSLWDLFSEPLDDSALIGSLRVLVDEWEWNGGCAPVPFGDPLGSMGPALGDIDVGMCGNLVIALVWTVILGLAVLGMAGRLIRTLWTFGQYEKANYV